MKAKILVADDEKDVLDLVSANLKSAGFSVIEALDGASAVARARSELPALIILDLMLPKMSGFEVYKVLKRDPATSQIPVVMLTAKAEETDRILGLELGAEDYITKPFSPRELVLRVKSVVRRAGSALNETVEVGDIVLDRSKHEVSVKGKLVELTATEFKLLAILMERRGRLQGRDALLNDVWGYESAIDTRTVDTHMRRLRDKLGKSSACIETVRGFGYRIA
jgi:two-component system phosphate regulon response regulator PhoB